MKTWQCCLTGKPSHTQSHYPDTESTSPCSILIMPNTWLGSDKYQFYKSFHWLDQGLNTQSPTREDNALPIRPRRPVLTPDLQHYSTPAAFLNRPAIPAFKIDKKLRLSTWGNDNLNHNYYALMWPWKKSMSYSLFIHNVNHDASLCHAYLAQNKLNHKSKYSTVR